MNDILTGETISKEKRHPNADTLAAYERAHLRLLKDYKEEIQLIEHMMEQLRQERKDFYLEELPKIKAAMTEHNVSEAYQEEWFLEIQRNMELSFHISELLIQHYVTDNLEEFQRKLRDAINRV